MISQPYGLAAIILFYGVFFAVGTLAGRRGNRKKTADEMLLAGRRLPLWLATVTLISTWVGGGYINGTAEAVYDQGRGLVWAQAPWCYAVSLVLGGVFFARRMRRAGYTTMLDVFEQRYGRRTAAILYVPALCGEMFWMAAILTALGTAFGTMLGIDAVLAIVLSAIVAILYTVVGGIWSVAYTDSLQLLCIAAGTCVALPFALSCTGGLGATWASYQLEFGAAAYPFPGMDAWKGPQPWGWQWGDTAVLLMLGGIPWQVYFQRVLACDSDRNAMRLSVLAGVGCLLMAIPSVLLGMVGATIDWSTTTAGPPESAALVLPHVLAHLTPPLIAVVGLCAVSAAVMSSVDSSILSASSMFAWNIYRPFKTEATDREVLVVMRIMIVVIGTLGALLAVTVHSVYTLWYLSADLVFVVLFPQLVMALYAKRVHVVGALAGLVVGLVLRLGGGEPQLGIPAIIPYPMQDPDWGCLFPFRTFAMLLSLITIAGVSRWRCAFERRCRER
jgi:high affinity choline transporter 7